MNSLVSRGDDIIWRQIEGETVVITPDGLSLHVLNKTAALIWELCDGTKGPDEIATILCERFDVSPEEVSADVKDTIGKLEGLGLLTQTEEKADEC